MISVRNHQLQSSGNKLAGLIVLLVALLLSACKTKDQLPRKPRTTTPPPKKKQVLKPKPKVDTVQWTEVEREVKSEDPDKGDEFEGASSRSSYDVAVLFPFDAASMKEATDTDDRFVNYYGGMLMALDILNNQGKQLNVSVRDIGDRNTKLDDEVAQLVGGADLVIAPFHKRQVKAVAQYGLRKKTTVVSPWLVSSKVTKDNPYYVKLMPDLTDYYQAIMSDITSRYHKEQVVIIGNDSDGSKIKYLQGLAKAMYGTGNDLAIEQYIVDQDSLMNGETAFDSIFYRQDDLVVVIPNYSNSDESFVYNCVRRLAVEKGEKKVVTYGMPLILDSDRMEYDYFKSLNMHVARSKYVDREDHRVQSFKRDYYARFGAIPTDDSYEGYDMMMYVGESLWESGKTFQTRNSGISDKYLQSSFLIAGKPKKDVEMVTGPEDVEYYSNKKIDIISFKDGRFTR